MEDKRLFEFIEKMYNEMQHGFKEINNRLDKVEDCMDKVDNKLGNNTILLESLKVNVEKIVEVQKISYRSESKRT